MSSITEITQELKLKTGLSEKMEEDLIRRIAEVKEQGSIVDGLNKNDWILTVILIVIFGVAPIVLVCTGII